MTLSFGMKTALNFPLWYVGGPCFHISSSPLFHRQSEPPPNNSQVLCLCSSQAQSFLFKLTSAVSTFPSPIGHSYCPCESNSLLALCSLQLDPFHFSPFSQPNFTKDLTLCAICTSSPPLQSPIYSPWKQIALVNITKSLRLVQCKGLFHVLMWLSFLAIFHWGEHPLPQKGSAWL